MSKLEQFYRLTQYILMLLLSNSSQTWSSALFCKFYYADAKKGRISDSIKLPKDEIVCFLLSVDFDSTIVLARPTITVSARSSAEIPYENHSYISAQLLDFS